jgi:hypothetical protein
MSSNRKKFSISFGKSKRKLAKMLVHRSNYSRKARDGKRIRGIKTKIKRKDTSCLHPNNLLPNCSVKKANLQCR